MNDQTTTTHRCVSQNITGGVVFFMASLKKPLLALLLLSFLACGRNDPPGPFPGATVILISVDTLRSDRLPVYGYTQIETPHIDAFAADSLVYERAYSPCPLTLPAHATLFTGLLPTQTGVRDNSFYEVPQHLDTLAERLGEAGYATGGVVSSVILGSRTGIDQGFAHYQSDLRDERGDQVASRGGKASIALALDWLKTRPVEDSSFLFLHLFEPHTPYAAPEPFASAAKHPYDAEVAYTDHLLGEFFAGLKELGHYENSIILLVSDHGEGLGDHGEAEHGILLHREAIQVPFILKLPENKRKGTRVTFPVMLADVKPTLENLLGLKAAPVIGKDLFDGSVAWQTRPIYGETRYPFNNYGYPAGTSVIRGPVHYIRHGSESLYDMIQDSAERQNLLPGQMVPAEVLGYLEAVGSGVESKSGEAGGDLELLASLGYSAVQVEQAQSLNRPISDLLLAVEQLEQSADYLKQNQPGKARQVLEALLQEQPCLHQARLDLGRLLERDGDLAVLEKHYEQALLCDAKNLRFLMLTGHLKIRGGKLEEAKRLAEQIWLHGTREAKGEFAGYFQSYGAFEDAKRLALLLLQEEPNHPQGNLILGEQALSEGRYPQAREVLTSAAEHFGPDAPADLQAKTQFLLGECHRNQDALPAALSAYERALQFQPNHVESRVAATLVLAGMGKSRGAIQMMDAWVRDFPSKQSYQIAARTMRTIQQLEAAAFFQNQSLKYP